MIYKIMSTVKARFDTNGEIVSPVQTMLKDGILKNSDRIDKNIQKKIVNSNLVVDKHSICRDNICRGDIYVETNEPLSLLEQRKLVDGMSGISMGNPHSPMIPVVIRNAPGDMPEPVGCDDNHNYGALHHKGAFISAGITATFDDVPSDKLKETYRGANDIARSLNKELNHLGLRTVFADMSMCGGLDPVKRRCCVIFQKTSRFNADTYSDDKLEDVINKAFASPKLGNIEASDISIDDDISNNSALIGSLSLENVQMAGKRYDEFTTYTENLMDHALFGASVRENPLFANGFASDKYTDMLFGYDIPKSPVEGYQSSTEQDLSTQWKRASAFAINISGDMDTVSRFRRYIPDIVSSMNEAGGYSEEKPLVKDILVGANANFGKLTGQSLIIPVNHGMIKGQSDKFKKLVTDGFTKAVAEYPEFSDININGNLPMPLIADVKSAKPYIPYTPSLAAMPKTHAKLNDGMLGREPENIKEQQINF